MGFENQHPNTYSGDPHCSLPYPLPESGQAKNKKFKLEGGGRPVRLRQEVQKFKVILDYLARPQDTVPKQSKTRISIPSSLLSLENKYPIISPLPWPQKWLFSEATIVHTSEFQKPAARSLIVHLTSLYPPQSEMHFLESVLCRLSWMDRVILPPGCQRWCL